MKHKGFAAQQCPIARSLERVGEWWSLMILRDVFFGLTRFDELQKSLDIAPNMLTRRLSSLVESGLLERRLYSERPPRYEYVPSALAQDFRPVLWALLAWGNRNFFPDGPSVVLVDRKTGAVAEPLVIDRISGRPMTAAEFYTAPGPAANEATRARYEPKREPSAAAQAFPVPVTRSPRRPSRKRP
jgi:DNA-binding HxlR family transcriptional regulator